MWTHEVQTHVIQGTTWTTVENKASKTINDDFSGSGSHKWESWRGTWCAGCYVRGKRRKKSWSQWEWTKNKLDLLHHFARQSFLLNQGVKLKNSGSLVVSMGVTFNYYGCLMIPQLVGFKFHYLLHIHIISEVCFFPSAVHIELISPFSVPTLSP